MEFLFWFSLAALYYVYDGYLRLLRLVALGKPAARPTSDIDIEDLPSVTVLVTAFNEAEVIEERIRNILEMDYPRDRLKVLVASDGSTDGTDDVVKGFTDERVGLFRPERQQGKTQTQNLAVPQINTDIILFTDADTRFDRMFLRHLVGAFTDPKVGGAGGHLLFVSDAHSSISQSQGFYWRYELQVRELESRLGILAVASGPCLAIRRHLFLPMNPAYGEDCVVPLEIVQQGYKMVHVSNALAYDTMDTDADKELKTRTRMTLRNWQGTWSYPELLNPFQNPGYAFALWSHKILRWLSPLFLIVMTIAAIGAALQGDIFFQFVATGIALFYAVGFLGRQAEQRKLRIPVAPTIYSFLLANLGFLGGLWHSLRGRRISIYR